jgi:4-amino-4-deoxy-L-arabinose transferase-like glycosyltransferase
MPFSSLFGFLRSWTGFFSRTWVRFFCATFILVAGLYGHPIQWDFLRDALPGDAHAPLSQRLLVWRGFLGPFLAGGAVLFLAYHWGGRLRRLADLPIQNFALSLAADLCLGANLLSLLSLGLGLCGLWDGHLFSLLTILGFSEAVASTWKSKTLFSRKNILQLPAPSHFTLTLLVILGSLTLLADFFHAVLPDVYYDSLVYHLAAPEAWRSFHTVTDLSFNLYAHFPMGAECFFSWATSLAGPEAGKVLQAALTLAICLASAGWVCERCGRDAGYLAFGLCAAFPILAFTTWSLHAEPFLSLNLLLLLYVLARAKESGRGSWLIAAGFLTGALVGIKYTAVPWAFCVWTVWFFTNPRPTQRTLLVAAALALIPALPWFLKNEYFSGAPFYPFFTKDFPAWGLRSFQDDAQSSIQATLNGNFSWFPDLFFHRGYGLSALAALGFWVLTTTRHRPESSDLRFLGLTSWCLLGTALAFTYHPRLLLPSLIVFLTALAMCLGSPTTERSAFQMKTAALLAFIGFFLALPSLLSISLRHYQSPSLWLGRETRQAYLLRLSQTSHLRSGFSWASALPADAKVLLVGEARTAYLPFHALAGSAFDEPLLARLARRCDNEIEIARQLRRLGITHLWIAGDEGARLNILEPEAWALPPEARVRLTRFLRGHTRLAAQDGPDILLILSDPQAGVIGYDGLPWLKTPLLKGDNAS